MTEVIDIKDAKKQQLIQELLHLLSPREERVLRMRYGIGMDTDYTLEEVGNQFNVERDRIRQLEAKALRKLKTPETLKKIQEAGYETFLDLVKNKRYFILKNEHIEQKTTKQKCRKRCRIATGT